MRRPVDRERVLGFMRALGAEADSEARLYFTGGATALAAQALAKIERGHAQDRSDVGEMLARGWVAREELLARFAQIEPHLYRYPAIDPAAFRQAVGRAASGDLAVPPADTSL